MIKTIDEINAEWAEDSKDFEEDHDLAKHSRKQLSLHQKYYSWLNQHLLKKLRLTGQLALLQNEKTDYYSGEMTLERMKELNWPINPKRMVKAEVARAVNHDPDIIDITQRIGVHTTTIEYLENIIKKLNQRSFDIKNIIEYNKFVSGVA